MFETPWISKKAVNCQKNSCFSWFRSFSMDLTSLTMKILVLGLSLEIYSVLFQCRYSFRFMIEKKFILAKRASDFFFLCSCVDSTQQGVFVLQDVGQQGNFYGRYKFERSVLWRFLVFAHIFYNFTKTFIATEKLCKDIQIVRKSNKDRPQILLWRP